MIYKRNIVCYNRTIETKDVEWTLKDANSQNAIFLDVTKKNKKLQQKC